MKPYHSQRKIFKILIFKINGMLCKWNSNMRWCWLRQQKHSIFTCHKLKFVNLKIRVQTPYLTNFEAAIWSSKIHQICFNILTPLFHYVKIDPHFCHWICPMCAGIPYMHLCHACRSGRTPCHRGETQSLCQINALVAGHYPTQRSPFLTWTIRPQDLHRHFWAIGVACFRHGEHRNAYGDPIVCIIEGNQIKIFNAVIFTHAHLEHIIDLINLLKIGR